LMNVKTKMNLAQMIVVLQHVYCGAEQKLFTGTTFPFNPDGSLDGGLPIARQSFVEAAVGEVAVAKPDGKKCIDKVEMVEETEYDDVVECEHISDKKCHTSFATYYQSYQEEECEETYKKNCIVEYEHIVRTVNFCSTPLRRECNEDECGFAEYKEECYEKTQTVVQRAPKEQCSLEPAITCKNVSKLIPKLGPTEACVDVPKEVCKEYRINPKKVNKPVFKTWCYVPNKEV